ncbi:MAG: hypothetical protein JKY99_05040 [Rhizobiales bacterium]|nr:hypothetical protein [Hyphomicrobiales bacterium]
MKSQFLAMATGLMVLLSPTDGAHAQSLSDLKAPAEPLVLAEQGSFFVGGRTVHAENSGWDELRDLFGGAFESGDVVVDQMYVQYQKPVDPTHTPIVFMHGCCLSSKTWESTPDGRMGWYEYFTRNGFPTYMAEQTGRARSGFNGVLFNQVRAGDLPPQEQPRILLATKEFAWAIFRFGPELGEAWPDQQFPMNKVDELYKQVIPDMIKTEVPSLLQEFISPTTNNPTIDNFADLATQLDGAILVGHSQSSGFPTQAVLKGKSGIKGIIQLETGCFGDLNDAQIEAMAEIPILIMVGDHFGEQPGADCIAEMKAVNAAGGDMTFIALPDAGLKGNSHMFMQDLNNIQVADIVIDWVAKHVDN